MTSPPTPSWRLVSATLAGAVLLAAAAACTSSDDPAPRPDAGAGASSTTPEPGTAPEAAPAPPARVRVTRVSGKLKEKDREVLADNVAKVVTAYFDDAYLGGEYPRESFGDAFATFTSGAAREADADRDLLTNRVLGPTTEAVEVERRTAYLSVLAPYDVAAGVTARVHLRFRAERGDRLAKRVDVKGRLMLTRAESGGWKIFGYDLIKNVRTAGGGA